MKEWAKKFMLNGFIAATLAACSTSTVLQRPLVAIDLPAIGQPAHAISGAVILDRARYRTAYALTLNGDLVWEQGLLKFMVTVPSGVILAASRDAEYTYFVSNNATFRDISPATAEFRVRNSVLSNPAGDVPSSEIFPTMPFATVLSHPQIRKAQLRLFDATSIEKEFIYRGRMGDIIHFEYRGRSGATNEPQAVQQLDWDLKDGRILPVAGARLEILDIDGDQLTYRVLSTFTDALQ